MNSKFTSSLPSIGVEKTEKSKDCASRDNQTRLWRVLCGQMKRQSLNRVYRNGRKQIFELNDVPEQVNMNLCAKILPTNFDVRFVSAFLVWLSSLSYSYSSESTLCGPMFKVKFLVCFKFWVQSAELFVVWQLVDFRIVNIIVICKVGKQAIMKAV